MRPTDLTDGAIEHRVTRRHDAAGVTLVELLVAMLLLGVILSAAASSLIQFGRTAADNERRVQATALMNRLHEELQALPWQDAAIYEDDLEALHAGGYPGLVESTAWEFDGLEVATLIGPDGGERRDAVPHLVTPVTIDDRDYSVVRFVTWSDRDAGIKRFTTIVGWSLYDRTYEERFVSERAATAAEAGDPELPRVVQFQVGPSPMSLDDDGAAEPAQNSKDILITVRFSEGVDAATVRYGSVEVTLDGDGEIETLGLSAKHVTLTPYITDPVTGRSIAFRGVIAEGSRTFPNGTRTFEVEGQLGGDIFTGQTSMEFQGGSIEPEQVGEEEEESPEEPEDPSAVPIAVTNVTVSRSVVCIDADHRFTRTVTVDATVDGMIAPTDYDVSVTYTADGSPRSESMEPVVETFSADGATFRTTFSVGEDHGFRLQGNGNNATDETDFRVTASRPSGGEPDDRSSLPQTLTVRSNHPSNSPPSACS